MQHIINRLVSLVVLLLVFAGAKAQTDSVLVIKIDSASGKYAIRAEKIKTDSVHRYKEALRLKKQTRYHTVQDSVKNLQVHKFRVVQDSLRNYKRYQDSNYRKVMRKAYAMNDSAWKRQNYKRYQDSSFRKMQFKAYHTYDSLHKKYRDSSFRKMPRNAFARQDSLYRSRKFEAYHKMDSLYLKQLKFRIVRDSLKMKIYKEQRDSVYRKMKAREVVMELPVNKADKIFITPYYQEVRVRNGEPRKVKLTTTVYEEGKIVLSDREWFNRLKTGLQLTDSGITITANASVKKETTVSYSTNVAGTYTLAVQSKDTVKEEQYNMPRKVLFVDIPPGMTVYVVSRYSDVAFDDDQKDVNVNISNGKLQMRNAVNAVIKSRFGAVQAGYITKADIELTNGKLNCNGIGNLQIDSKYSTVSFGNSGKINMKSLSDKYELREVNNLEGYKTFGQLNIQTLLTDMVLKGSSADVNVTNFGANALLVKISNKYADVKLPVNTLVNYTANVDGVNNRMLGKLDSMAAGKSLPPLNNGKIFTASGGNLSGLHTKLQLDCNNCVVDLR